MNTALYELLEILNKDFPIEFYVDGDLVYSGYIDDGWDELYYYRDYGINDLYVKGKYNKTVYIICDPA